MAPNRRIGAILVLVITAPLLALALFIATGVIGDTIIHTSHGQYIAEIRCKDYYEAARSYREKHGDWPDPLDQLEQEIWPDPWGNPYSLEIPGKNHARVCSAGPDGISETDDDICYPPDAE